jgi:hypothetical protein
VHCALRGTRGSAYRLASFCVAKVGEGGCSNSNDQPAPANREHAPCWKEKEVAFHFCASALPQPPRSLLAALTMAALKVHVPPLARRRNTLSERTQHATRNTQHSPCTTDRKRSHSNFKWESVGVAPPPPPPDCPACHQCTPVQISVRKCGPTRRRQV